MKNVKCLRCIKCGREYEALPDATTCECGGILDVIYDYDYIRNNFTPEDISSSDNYTMWRYRPFLPVEEDTEQPPLRVGWSPLYEVPRVAEKLGIRKFWLKGRAGNWKPLACPWTARTAKTTAVCSCG